MMAPSTLLQSRINAFEAMGKPSSVSLRNNGTSISPSILEEPISSEADSFSPIAPFTPPHSISRSPSPSPPNLGRKTSLIDLRDWIVDDGPSPPRQNHFGPKYTNGKTMTSNGNNNSRTPTQRAWDGRATSAASSAPLINLDSPPRVKPIKVPPLPPRKPSYSSLKAAGSSNTNGLRPPVRLDSLTVEKHTYPPLSKFDSYDALRKGPGHAPASSISSFHSVSLSSDGGTLDAEASHDQLHIATFPMDRQSSEGDADSLDESFENVSSTCVISPTSAATLAFDWEKAMGKAKQLAPPKLPQRPSSKSPSSVPPLMVPTPPPPCSVPSSPKLSVRSVSSSSIATTTRRAPPPPPHTIPPSRSAYRSSRTSLASASASDRSSILSTATTTSRTSVSTRASTQTTSKLSRPTPVPAAAKKRYETVFVANILQRRKVAKSALKKPALLTPSGTRKSRQAAGWRGLSVDLITNPHDHPVLSGKEKGNDEDELDKEVGLEERLDGYSVKTIWSASRLEEGKLRAIWNECDVARRGSLDRDAFVKGMWRIDEELRRAQFTRHTSRIRSPQIRHTNPRLILR